ncbi:hypothetical protein [Streptococcus bovimastitidis]|nr:hypothetical protein [Streptococcus bovimastitidis]
MLSYLCVIPLLTFIERIFTIENFKFTYPDLTVTKRYLWITDSSLVIYFLGFYFFESKNAEGGDLFWLSKILILIFFFIFLYLASYLNNFYRSIVQKQIEERESRHMLVLEQYNHYIENLYKGVRSFRHDYHNILLSLEGSINQGDIDAINTVYHETLDKMAKSTQSDVTFDTSYFAGLKNTQLEIYLTLKREKLAEKGITFELVSDSDLSQPPIKEVDLLLILSSLLEIAELTTSCEGSPYIKLFLKLSQSQRLSILVESSYSKDWEKQTRDRKLPMDKVRLILRYYLKEWPELIYKRDKTDFLLLQSLTYSPSHEIEK